MIDERDAAKVGCEDDQGLMFHVWQRKVGAQSHVAIAFRGTSGRGDWWYGNLWWLTRFFIPDNQLTRARKHVERIVKHFEQEARAKGEDPPRFVATGHSLGGSLAQHALYAFPNQVEQAIVFDPSSVTGFVDVSQENRINACSCRRELAPEARVFRVYQTYEVLANRQRQSCEVVVAPDALDVCPQ